jgi:hypothetical protein
MASAELPYLEHNGSAREARLIHDHARAAAQRLGDQAVEAAS